MYNYIIVYNNINVHDHVHAGGGVPMSVYYLVNLVGWQGVPITSKGGRTLFQDLVQEDAALSVCPAPAFSRRPIYRN